MSAQTRRRAVPPSAPRSANMPNTDAGPLASRQSRGRSTSSIPQFGRRCFDVRLELSSTHTEPGSLAHCHCPSSLLLLGSPCIRHPRRTQSPILRSRVHGPLHPHLHHGAHSVPPRNCHIRALRRRQVDYSQAPFRRVPRPLRLQRVPHHAQPARR